MTIHQLVETYFEVPEDTDMDTVLEAARAKRGDEWRDKEKRVDILIKLLEKCGVTMKQGDMREVIAAVVAQSK